MFGPIAVRASVWLHLGKSNFANEKNNYAHVTSIGGPAVSSSCNKTKLLLSIKNDFIRNQENEFRKLLSKCTTTSRVVEALGEWIPS